MYFILFVTFDMYFYQLNKDIVIIVKIVAIVSTRKIFETETASQLYTLR